MAEPGTDRWTDDHGDPPERHHRTYTHDVYGATTSSTGSQPNPFQFAGQQTDPTGLQYLRARYYDPVTGTFLSSDPLGVSPAWPNNPYAYANGNPATLVDPYGLFGIPGFVKKAAKAVASVVSTSVGAVTDSSVWRPIAGAALVTAVDVPGIALTIGCVSSGGLLCPVSEAYDMFVLIPGTYVGVCMMAGTNLLGIPGFNDVCGNGRPSSAALTTMTGEKEIR